MDSGADRFAVRVRLAQDLGLTADTEAAGTPPGFDIETVYHDAAREVDRLVDELESTLDARERRLLHQLRLAAETSGAIRTLLDWRRSRW